MRLVLYVACLTACGFEHGQLGSTDAGETGDSGDAQHMDVAAIACPPSYTITLPSTSTRYRVLATISAFLPHHQTCNNDAAGRTHLASLETVNEAMDLRDAIVTLGNPGGTQYYVGAVQKPSQATSTDGWFAFTGPALPGGLWLTTPGDDNPGENNEENLGALNTVDLMHDVTGDVAYPAICECDGLLLDPTVAGYIP